MSVWEDEAALMDFVSSGFHKDAMPRFHSDMGATKFVRWKILGTDVPVTWDVALERTKS